MGLQDSDIVLAVDGVRVESFRDLEMAVRNRALPSSELLIVRGGKKMTVQVPLTPLSDDVADRRRVVLWCGAVLHCPPLAVAAQRGQERLGVYVSSRFSGSPASRYN